MKNRNEVFLQTAQDHQVDFETADNGVLSTFYENAMSALGGRFEKVEAWRTQRGLAFRITVPMPEWVQRHLAEFVTEEVQREQAEFEARAAARAAKNAGSVKEP